MALFSTFITNPATILPLSRDWNCAFKEKRFSWCENVELCLFSKLQKIKSPLLVVYFGTDDNKVVAGAPVVAMAVAVVVVVVFGRTVSNQVRNWSKE